MKQERIIVGLWKGLGLFAALALCVAGLSMKGAGPRQERGVLTRGQRENQTVSQADPLEDFRSRREKDREEHLDRLEKLAKDTGAGEQLRARAREEMMELMECARQETEVEGLLRAQGFPQVLCTVREGAVNLLVRGETPSKDQLTLAMETILRQTGQPGGSVKVIPLS